LNGPLCGTTQVSPYQKDKTDLDLLKQETENESGISWTICKSASRPRQTGNLTSTPPLSFFTGWMPFVPPNQQQPSTEGIYTPITAGECGRMINDILAGVQSAQLTL